MSNVTLRIAGRTYRLGCAEGEEAHIAALGEAIDAKLASVPGMAGKSEQHTLLYAALLMADELHDQRQEGGSGPRPASIRAEPLEKLASRLETLAVRLEQSAANT